MQRLSVVGKNDLKISYTANYKNLIAVSQAFRQSIKQSQITLVAFQLVKVFQLGSLLENYLLTLPKPSISDCRRRL